MWYILCLNEQRWFTTERRTCVSDIRTVLKLIFHTFVHQNGPDGHRKLHRGVIKGSNWGQMRKKNILLKTVRFLKCKSELWRKKNIGCFKFKSKLWDKKSEFWAKTQDYDKFVRIWKIKSDIVIKKQSDIILRPKKSDFQENLLKSHIFLLLKIPNIEFNDNGSDLLENNVK